MPAGGCTSAALARDCRRRGDRIGYRRRIENRALRVRDRGESASDFARGFGEAVFAPPIGCLRKARQRRDRTVDEAQNVRERHLGGGLQEPIASVRAALRGDEAATFKLEQNLFEEFARNALAIGDLCDLQRLTRLSPGKFYERPQGVLGLLRNHATAQHAFLIMSIEIAGALPNRNDAPER